MDNIAVTDLEQLRMSTSPKTTVILVIDAQNDFCASDGRIASTGGDIGMIRGMIPCMADFLKQSRCCGLPIIYLQHINSPETMSPVWAARRVFSKRGQAVLCARGSSGAEIIPEVAPQAGDLVVEKNRYSGFIGTRLEVILRAQAIKSVVVTGVSTNVCVESTARDAFMRDFFVIVPEDCVASTHRELHRPALVNLSQYFALITTSTSLVESWQTEIKG
ncbi:MAG: cysteine hydrolase [Deltaproteobacteria bacterium]|nr:cysteine hydrolase [Deltaproteobacteria bacterium]